MAGDYASPATAEHPQPVGEAVFPAGAAALCCGPESPDPCWRVCENFMRSLHEGVYPADSPSLFCMCAVSYPHMFVSKWRKFRIMQMSRDFFTNSKAGIQKVHAEHLTGRVLTESSGFPLSRE